MTSLKCFFGFHDESGRLKYNDKGELTGAYLTAMIRCPRCHKTFWYCPGMSIRLGPLWVPAKLHYFAQWLWFLILASAPGLILYFFRGKK